MPPVLTLSKLNLACVNGRKKAIPFTVSASASKCVKYPIAKNAEYIRSAPSTNDITETITVIISAHKGVCVNPLCSHFLRINHEVNRNTLLIIDFFVSISGSKAPKVAMPINIIDSSTEHSSIFVIVAAELAPINA